MPEPAAKARAALKALPSVDDLLKVFPPENYPLPRRQVLTAVRAVLAQARKTLLAGEAMPQPQVWVRESITARLGELARPNLRPVLNGTGVVLHTGLGRAPLGNDIMDRAACATTGYANLELDLSSGRRGERLGLVADLLHTLTGAQDVLVVNNNAAAVLLMLNSLAEGREVIISRGQQVEIGGSFRIPDVIAKAGVGMVEVGTTNRTHLADYERAINAQTAALLYVHPSNYRVAGFTAEVAVSDLARLARRKKLPLMMDLGSGSLLAEPVPGVTDEPEVSQVLKAGADLVSFSGDKLLGGPQAGIIVGRKKWLRRLHQNPLYRALRCDKVTLALLEQTLRTYIDRTSFRPENLALRLLHRDRSELAAQARALLDRLPESLAKEDYIKVVESNVEAGSGSLPGVALPSMALAVTVPGESAGRLAARFRQAKNPVVGHVHRGRYYIDLKAIPAEKNHLLAETLEEVLWGR